MGETAIASVTAFGEILENYLERLFIAFEFLSSWANFNCCELPTISKKSCYLVTLAIAHLLV